MKIFIVLFLIAVVQACVLLPFLINKNETAHVYRHKTTGDLLYCSNQHTGQPRDFDYIGTASVKKSDIRICGLA